MAKAAAVTPEVLAIVPTYLRSAHDQLVLMTMLRTLRETAPDLEVLVVDDGSPAQAIVDELAGTCEGKVRLHRKRTNDGFSTTVNVGLAEALERGMHGLLVNADIEFTHPGWLERMVAQPAANGDVAAVVGAQLLYPNGLIQHGGIFFSVLSRTFGHIHHYAPADLPEAGWARTCPVTGALQLIRHDTLASVGLYDEKFTLGSEDVDYCLRVFLNGGSCVMQPLVRALHHESLFRGRANARINRWTMESWDYFTYKHRETPLATYVPSVV